VDRRVENPRCPKARHRGHPAGYEDLNDAERLSQDMAFRLIGSEKIRDRSAALPSSDRRSDE
jgi:hypothetical protein